MIQIKRITAKDLDFARQLRNENSQYFFSSKEITALDQWEWFKKIRKDKKLWFYIIYFDKIRIGTIAYGKGEIKNIVIDKEYRRKGYLKEAMKLLLNKHKGKAFLKVLPNNIGALKAYKALGFKEKEKTLWI